MGGLFGSSSSTGTISNNDTFIGAVQVQSSSYGLTVPLVYGRTRVPGNLVWYGGFTAVPHTTTQEAGGKGGGGQKTTSTTWSYYASYCFGIAEGIIGSIQSLWKNTVRYTGYWQTFGDTLVEAEEHLGADFDVNQRQNVYTLGSSHPPVLEWQDAWEEKVEEQNTDDTWSWRYYTQTAWREIDPSLFTIDASGHVTFTPSAVINDSIYNGAQTPNRPGHQISERISALAYWLECGGPVRITYTYRPNPVWVSAESQTGMELATGAIGQPIWSTISRYDPAAAIGFSGTACVRGTDLSLGSDATISQYTFELNGRCQFAASSGIYDANPADIVTDVLTSAGWPASSIGDLSSYKNYCTAQGLFLSPAITDQQEAQNIICDLLAQTNSELVWSDGRLRIVPHGDETLNGNGITWTPNLAPLYDLTDDDFLADGSDDPVQVTRTTPADIYNQVTIEYLDRDNEYNIDVAEMKDLANIEQFGLRPKDSVEYHGICETETANLVAQLILQRSLYLRNTYEFRLGWAYCLLEPMDIVTITDAGCGLDRKLVRIVDISEDDYGTLSVSAEDMPEGGASACKYPVQRNAGYQHDFNAAPGAIEAPVFLEAPVSQSSTGLAVWIAVTGAASATFWGGCRAWVSLDGNTYKQMGTLHGGTRYGHLSSAMVASGSNCSVQLIGQGGKLLAGTSADAHNNATLCWVDGEFFNYESATLTGSNAYNLGNLHRGAYSSVAGDHASGSAFVRVDNALLKSDALDTDLVGQTLYFKFTSFNIFGAAEEALADVTAYRYTLTGNMLKLPPANVTGLSCSIESAGIRLQWSVIADADVDAYMLRVGGTNWDSATPIAEVKGNSYLWAMQPSGNYTLWIKARDLYGNLSEQAGQGQISISGPAAPTLSANLLGANMVLNWVHSTSSWPIDHYELRQGEHWADASLIAQVATATYTEAVQYASRRYWVAAIDSAGVEGIPGFLDVSIQPPAQVAVSVEVIDNNVLLRWGNAQTALPIDHYELRKGESWAKGSVVGIAGGQFSAIFEQAGGTYTYWVVGVDVAGNRGDPAGINAVVAQPPDFVLVDLFTSTLNGTATHLLLQDGKLTGPFDTTQTWGSHFATSGWASPQDQIAAGYPRYLQPGELSASYEEIFDAGAIVTNTSLTATLTYSVQEDSITVTPSLALRNSDSDAWVEYPGISQMVGSQFRYVRVRYDFAATDQLARLDISGLTLKLSQKTQTDAGSGTALAAETGGTEVHFNRDFSTVTSIKVSASGTTPCIMVYDFDDQPHPSSFKVLAFDTNGNRIDHTFGWSCDGIV